MPWLLCELNETYNGEHLAESMGNEGRSTDIYSLSVIPTDVIGSRQVMYNLIGKKKISTCRKGFIEKGGFSWTYRTGKKNGT